MPEYAEVRCRSRRASSSADSARSAPASVRESTSSRSRDCAHVERPQVEAILVVLARAAGRPPACRRARSSRRAASGPTDPARRTGVRAASFSACAGAAGRQRAPATAAASAAPKPRKNHGAPERRARTVCYTAVQYHLREFRDGQQSSLPGRARRERAHRTARRMRDAPPKAEHAPRLPEPRRRSSIRRPRAAMSSTSITA